MTRWPPILLGLLLLAPQTAVAQELPDATIRGEDVWLRPEPSAVVEPLAYLQRGDAVTVTGNAEDETGRTKLVNAGSLGITRTWYVPVEVAETGDAGWVAELFIDPGESTPGRVAPTPAPITPTAVPALESPAASDPPRQKKQNRKKDQAPVKQPAESRPANDVSGASVDDPAAMGDTLDYRGLHVTVSNADFNNGSDFDKPKGGYRYLNFDVEMSNDGEETINYDWASFSGQDEKTGAGFDSVFFPAVETPIESGALDPGEFVSGTVQLEVQETSKRIVIKFDPNSATLEDLYWVAP